MSGGEPSSIKRDHPCAARTPVPQLYTEEYFYRKGRAADVSGALPQVASQNLCRRGRPGAYHRDLAAPGGGGAAVARLSFHRHTRHRQDDLREDPRARGQLRAPGKRQPLQPLPKLPRHRERAIFGRGRAGRGVEQRRRQRARAARRGDLLPRAGEKARVYRRRSPHALNARVQRTAQDLGGAARASDVHSGDDGAAQGARDHSLALPALLLPPHPAERHCRQTQLHRAAGEYRPQRRRRGAFSPPFRRGAARCAVAFGPVRRRRRRDRRARGA